MELKQVLGAALERKQRCFNRTSVELKPFDIEARDWTKFRFNRTSVELKPEKTSAFFISRRALIEPVWN